MRASVVVLSLFVASAAPAAARDASPPAKHGKTSRPRTVPAKTSDLLPVPAALPPRSDTGDGPVGGDKSVHLGAVTLTPGGFLDVGTRGAFGRD